MAGPRISVRIAGSRVAVGIIDVILAVLVLTGVLRERMQPSPHLVWIIPAGLALVTLCFFINLLSERLRILLSHDGPPALPVLLSLPTAYAPSVAEATSPTRSARGGIAGMGVDLTIGLIAVAIYLLVDGSGRRLGDLSAVAAIAIGGSAAIRFLAAPSLNGGRVIRWMMEFTFDDDEDAIRGSQMIGYGAAIMLFSTGVILLTSEGEGGFWGIGIAAVAIDIALLSTLATRQTFWLQAAEGRTLGDLFEAPHAKVSVGSPLEEMLSVLSVDGPSVVAVVRDSTGNPAGIMQFQQMRAGVGKRGQELTIGDVMIPIDELPHVTNKTSLLDAAHLLLDSQSPALRFENAQGKTVIATARDMGLPR